MVELGLSELQARSVTIIIIQKAHANSRLERHVQT